MLILAAIVMTAIGVWLYQSASFAAANKLPPKLQAPLISKFAVDPYIWREPAFRSLRKRYSIAQVLLILALVLWALIAMGHHAGAAAALWLMAGVLAFFLLYRVLRHGL
jgi:hypothetical protein